MAETDADRRKNLALDETTNYVPGELLIKLRADSQAARKFRGVKVRPQGTWVGSGETNELTTLLDKHRAASVDPVFSRANASAKGAKADMASKRDGLLRWVRVRMPEGGDVRQALKEFGSHPAAEATELVVNYRTSGDAVPDPTTDPMLVDQWHLAAANVPATWDYLRTNTLNPGGLRDVVVAVIDTGVDYTHEDLVGNIWMNPREIPGNGLDDDNNGFVDDVHGCSVVADPRSHSGDPMDLNGHGTHVAGIIAATAFNHRGGVGVAFSVQIMAIRAGQPTGVFTSTDVAEAILYAVDNGAQIINMSFGGYTPSQVMQDALEMALGQAVLVAAAGNDATSSVGNPFYPASLPYVIGVMSHGPKGLTGYPLSLTSNHGPHYNVAAPGEAIWSTLPHGAYAKESGTSMAAPVISGIAALLRSYYHDASVYSSRFIMGQIVACAGNASSAQPGGAVTPPNALKMITNSSPPGISMTENWLFDNAAIASNNTENGRVDSGETLHLAIELYNRSGKASNVVAQLRAVAGVSGPDPYVSLLTDTVAYGAIGPFNKADNGLIRTSEGVVTGVQHPFVFSVDPNCPNDHVIHFLLTTTCRNGWDPTDTNVYTSLDQFRYTVTRGRDLPSVIDQDMNLTAAHFWIVKGPVLIEPGVTVQVGPGTQIQWGGISDDPYNPGPQNGNIVVRGTLRAEGTSDQPVSLFPSYLVSGQLVSIVVEGGTADLAFVKVRNPCLTGLKTVDHAYFDWELGASTITAQAISNTIFHKLRGGGNLAARVFERCLFDAGWLTPNSLGTQKAGWLTVNPLVIQDCAFLQDNENNHPISIVSPVTIDKRFFGGVIAVHPDFYDYTVPANWRGMYHAVATNGFTYVTLPAEQSNLEQAELIARFFGGHVASISSPLEQAFLEDYLAQPTGISWPGSPPSTYLIGLTDEGSPGNYHWLDGSPLGYTNWDAGFPAALAGTGKHVVAIQNSLFTGFDHGPERSSSWLGPWRNLNECSTLYRGDGVYFEGPAFILKLPGTWTAAQLNAAVTNGSVLAYVRPLLRSDFRYNAFLSKYWSSSVNQWMHVSAPNTAPYRTYSSMNFNYWGTATTNLVNYVILDYNDDYVSATIDYRPAPTNGFPSTYPFVEQILINGRNAEVVPVVEAGRTDFAVTFNRDMDTNIEPYVTFGPSPPHTDFLVTPRDDVFVRTTNGWLNPRTWQGSVWITPVTGNGYHLMRISGAVAANDPWLVTGYDVGRFRFKVATAAAASMALQAEGLEGAIQLTWQQNDYDLLAGYNLYRSTNIAGPFQKLNTTVIPPDITTYADTNVSPAVLMFYAFTVASTDFAESELSTVVSAAALDTLPPMLTHTPAASALPARGLRLTATATDNLRVTGVTVFYRPSGSGSNYINLAMLNTMGNDWSATVPGSAVQPPGVDYYLVASDGISDVFSGTPLLPHVVSVSNVPTIASVVPNHGSSEGGTAVTLSGTRFEPGVAVLFGGVLANNVTLMSEYQLTCTAPPHFPALVDVIIVNTNGTQGTLLSAFQFERTGAILSLPVTNGSYGTQVELSLLAANVAGLRAVDATIAFDSTVLSATDVRTGTLTAGWALSANLGTPGRAVLSMANGSSVTGNGSLAVLRFNVVKPPPAFSGLTIESVSLNDGAMTTMRGDGSFTVNGFFTLAGAVRYFGNSLAVPGTSLALEGAGTFRANSGTNGEFFITNIPTGSYVFTPSKTNQVVEITGYDASLVLQAAAGLLTLSPGQLLAADVNRSGTVSAMDASYILEKAVGLIDGPFPGSGRLWDFTPAQRTYSLLNHDQITQDFTAVLIGDVSGNWTAPADASYAPMTLQSKRLRGGGTERGGRSKSVVLAMDNGPLPGVADKRKARVLLKATDVSVYGIDLVFSYAPTNRAVLEVRPGGLADGMALAANTNQGGVVRASLATATPLAGSGSLVVISFAGGDPVEWQLDQARINEGQVSAILDVTMAAFDADRDGLVDADEVELFHTDAACADTDGDGMVDGAEVRAGTDPLRTSDVLSVAMAGLPNGFARVEWTAKAGKTYQVMKSLDLLSWTNALSGVGTNQQSLRTSVLNGLLDYVDPVPVTSPSGQAFYRVRLVE